MRIMVVDDNQDAADSLAAILRLWHHQAAVVYDGKTALRVARDFRPQVVILDIQMPYPDGGTIAAQLRQEHRNNGISILAISAFSKDDKRISRHEQWFDGYLPKPCDKDLLERMFSDTTQHSAPTNALSSESAPRAWLPFSATSS